MYLCRVHESLKICLRRHRVAFIVEEAIEGAPVVRRILPKKY